MMTTFYWDAKDSSSILLLSLLLGKLAALFILCVHLCDNKDE